MPYKVLSVNKFGKHLIETQDLDPVYTMLQGSNMTESLKKRWCLAYWCFYHCGVASKIAEAGRHNFHDMMRKAQKHKWPRGKERRHFRGEASSKAIKFLRNQGDAEDIVDNMLYGNTFQEVTDRVKTYPLFGPWIAFKVVDMAQQILHREINLHDCHLGIYKDPRQGAALILKGDWKEPITDAELAYTVNKLRKKFSIYRAPPNFNRQINIMEIETILCKYKSHYKGHYPLYNDSKEVYEMLNGWGRLAEKIQCRVPNIEMW